MKDNESQTLLARNLGLWVIAALLYPVAHWIPTSSGTPPRIFDILIPLMVMGLGAASHSLLGAALKKDRGE